MFFAIYNTEIVWSLALVRTSQTCREILTFLLTLRGVMTVKKKAYHGPISSQMLTMTLWHYTLIPCDTLWYFVIPCDTLWYFVIPCDTLWYFVIPCDTSWYLVIPPVALICCLAVIDFMTYFFPDFLCVYFQRDKIVTNQLSHVSALTVCL